MAYRDDLSASGSAAPPASGPASATPAQPVAAAASVARGPAPDAPERPAAPGPAAPPPAQVSANPTAPAGPAARGPAAWSRKRKILTALAAVATLVGGYEGVGWFTTGRFMVSTDDAYVGAHMTIMAAKVGGYVTAMPVETNTAVTAGQVIARIDDADYRLAVQAAADKVATQGATVARIERQTDAAKASVAQAQAQLAATRADAIRSVADYDRQTRLSQSDFASKARLEQSLADRDRASATVKGAEAGLLAAQANVAVLVAQAQEAQRTVAEYRTALAKTEHDLTFTEIRAPAAGVIGNRAVEVGSYVQTGTRLAALVPLDTVYVDANFKETQLGRIKPGQRATIEVDALPGQEVPAVVESIAPASGSQFSLLPPENATGNFTKIVQRVPVRLKVDAELARQGLLRPGLSVVARIDTRTGPAGR